MRRLFSNATLFSFFLIIVIACNSTENTPDKAILIRLSDIKLSLDSNTTPYTLCAQLKNTVDNKNKFFYMLNENTNAIQIYNLILDKKLNDIKFAKQGPNSTGKINGFFVDNNQNIYVINRDTREVDKVSLNGSIIKKYKLEQNSKRNTICPIPIVGDGVDISIIDDTTIMIPGNPVLVHDVDPIAFFRKSFLRISLNVVSGKVKYDINYPNADLLTENNYPPQAIMPFCTLGEGGSLIYSFGCDNNLYVFNRRGKFVKKSNLTSKYAPKKITPMSNSIKYSNAEECYVNYVNNLYYSALHYDKYRKYYYRVVKRPSKLEYTKNDLKNGKPIEQQWSIIIADKNFNKLGEADLPSDVWGGLILISKDGILLQKIITSEDEMIFSLFKIKV